MSALGRGSVCRCVLAAWLLAAAAPPLFAQVAAGEITGVVKDQADAAVPGATVTVTATRTNLQRVVISSAKGVFTVPSLPSGEYRVDVELPGFKAIRRDGIQVSTGEKVRIDFNLAVGTLSEQITVKGDAP